MDAEFLQQTLRTEIPLTKAMGIQVQSYDGQALILAASIEPNIKEPLIKYMILLRDLKRTVARRETQLMA